VPRTLRSVTIEFAELSDPGRDPSKRINEDSSGYFETPHGHLMVVCDGMGGHAAGQQASRLAVDTIADSLRAAPPGNPPGALLSEAVRAAAQAVYHLGGQAPADVRPGSTCVAALLHEGGAEVAHVGDSRLYWLHAGRSERVTRDHSMVQQMVDAGVLSPEEALLHPDANKITRALGMTPDVDVELRARPLPVQAGDVLLLASDGLVDLLHDEELGALVQKHLASGPAVACQELVALANLRGGHDNITVQLVQVLSLPARVAGPTLPSATVVDMGTTIPGDDGQRRVPASPTIVDEALSSPRTTEPAHPAGRLRGRFSDDSPAGAAGPRQARQLMLLGIAVSVAIVVAIVVWWLSSAVRAPVENEVPLPPAPSAPEARPEPVPAPLVPDLDEQLADAGPDAGGSPNIGPTE
jgi:protein phosphatase